MLHRVRYLLLLLAFIPLVTAAAMPPQNDGASGADASNVCSGDLVTLQLDGDFADGDLYPPRDSKDYYALEVDADDVGESFTVSLDGHPDMKVEVFMPSCGRSVVASSPSCANGGQCGTTGAWHVHDDGTGHDHCDAAGHQGDAGCDSEQGSASASGDSVTFTPSMEGTYYALVSVAPNSESGPSKGGRVPPDGDVVIYNCHFSCMYYSLTSTRDTPVTYVE